MSDYVIAHFLNNWGSFSKILASPLQNKSFCNYLAKYRGLGGDRKIYLPSESDREYFGTNLIEFFVVAFSQSKFFEKLTNPNETVTDESIKSYLNTIEQAINLSLYYWFGNNDRNFQFRTLIHFYFLEGLGAALFNKNGVEYVLSFSEHGIRLGAEGDYHIPQLPHLSIAWGVKNQKYDGPRFLTLPPLEQQYFYRNLFATIRSVQHEMFLLVEEWEHRNALLGLSYTAACMVEKKNPNEQNKEYARNALEDLNSHRNFLAEICIQAFTDVQLWIVEVNKLPLLNDIVVEIEALERLALSAMQKIHLPAAISRYKYDYKIAVSMRKWTEARLLNHPQDVSTLLFKFQLDMVIDGNSSVSVKQMLQQKPSEWNIAVDPTTPLKVFCWGITKTMHMFLTALTVIVITKKMPQHALNWQWLIGLVSLAEMPETFYPINDAKNMIKVKPEMDKLDSEFMQNILVQAKAIISQANLADDLAVHKNYLISFFA